MRGDWVEIRRSDITLKEKLGEGAFGEAYKGLVRMDGKVRECAVKKLKGEYSQLSVQYVSNLNVPVYLMTVLRIPGRTCSSKLFLLSDLRINTTRLFDM